MGTRWAPQEACTQKKIKEPQPGRNWKTGSESHHPKVTVWGLVTSVTLAVSQENRWELNKNSCLELSKQGVYLRHMTGDPGVGRHAE